MTKQESYYKHFVIDKPTAVGSKIAISVARKIFEKAELSKKMSVLELGPGRGHFANICKAAGVQYTAVEVNSELASDLRSRGLDVIEHKIPPIPDTGKKFDCVVMTHFLEHIDGTSAAIGLLEDLKRVMNNNCKLVILSPDYLYMGMYFFDVDFSHSFVTTKRRLRQLLLSSNFTVIRCEYMNGQFSGFLAVVAGLFFKLMPFYTLSRILNENMIGEKLYKLKMSFVRCVFITAELSQKDN